MSHVTLGGDHKWVNFQEADGQRPSPDDAILVERVIPSSELLLHMASVAHAGNLSKDHWFPQLTPYLQLTWPLEGWPQPDMDETKVMRILLARAIAESEGD